jgi:NAD(P)-dependent dehydrogenase (short-subunit alcohol dehydrogenase family)
MRGLRGKTIVVAGGGTGIGAATARRLGEESAIVLVGDYDSGAADNVAQQINAKGGRAISSGFDVRDRSGIAALLDLALKETGKLDGVHINVANMGLLMRDEDVVATDMSVFDDTLDVNLRGHVQFTQLAIPHLLKSSGALVYTSSETAYLSEPTRFSYAITKSGINTLMRHVAARWGREGVRANVVAPGFTLTPAIAAHISDEMKAEFLGNIHSPRHVSPEDIAAAVAFLLSDDAASINGQVINVDGGRVLRA